MVTTVPATINSVTHTATQELVIDGFEDLVQIGRGGQATVFRGQRVIDDELVAIKVFDRSLPTRTGRSGGRGELAAVRRFKREILSLRRVSDHPAVVSLLGSGMTEDGRNYLVLDYSTAGSLAELLPTSPMNELFMSIDEATVIGVRIAGAVERAHRAGLVHCDIKPGNVLAFEHADGTTDWRLSDFGIAMIDAQPTENLQMTVAHSAPEIFIGEPATEASDIYALASVVHTALTGHPPFEPAIGETTPAFMNRIATEPITDPREHGVPDVVASILERALHKDPARRHPSARVFGLALNQARAELGLDRVVMAISDGDDDQVTHVVDLHAVEQASIDDSSGDVGAASQKRRSWIVMLAIMLVVVGGVFTATGVGGDIASAIDVIDVIDVIDGPGDNGGGRGGNGGGGDGGGGGNGGGGGGRGRGG